MTKPNPYAEGYQMALIDILNRMDEEVNAINAAGAALGWIIHNSGAETRERATALVKRLFTEES